MKTGDTVRDGNGRTYKIGPLLGRGIWGKTYAVRADDDGVDRAMKVPLGPEELSEDVDRLAQACREIALEQGRLLEQAGSAALVRLESRFITADSTPALVMPRYGHNLERRLAEGLTVGELLGLVSKAAALARDLKVVLPEHAGLRAHNLLLDERGGVHLMDPVTPSLRPHYLRLARGQGIPLSHLPPEVREHHGPLPKEASNDSYALAVLLYRGLMELPAQPRGDTAGLPLQGVDKGALQQLKDTVLSRLQKEPGNPRFHARLVEQLGSLLNRALSRETSPSPPYRFRDTGEFARRLAEVTALVSPRVESVGRVLLDRQPGRNDFTTDEDIAFSCTVGCTAGVDTHEEIGCGIAVFDRDRDERLRNVACGFTVSRHPSGRFRFGFRVADLPPGDYRVRVAFTIREGGHEPATAEGTFGVLPAAGYVPARQDPVAAPLSLTRPAPDTVTVEAPTPAGNVPAAAAQAAVAAPVVEIEDTQDDASDADIELPAPRVAKVHDLFADDADDADAGASVIPLPTPISPPARTVRRHHGSGGAAASVAAAQMPQPQHVGPSAAVDAVASAQIQLDHPGPAAHAVSVPQPHDAPVYQGAGRWSELPLPGAGLNSDIDPLADQPDGGLDWAPTASPLDDILKTLSGLLQGDAYLLFLGAAAVVIVGLILALLLMT